MSANQFYVYALINFYFHFSTYFSYIIGAKGATKKRIELDTYTNIHIPGKGQVGDIGKDV